MLERRLAVTKPHVYSDFRVCDRPNTVHRTLVAGRAVAFGSGALLIGDVPILRIRTILKSSPGRLTSVDDLPVNTRALVKEIRKWPFH
jgi:hypothetical protein